MLFTGLPALTETGRAIQYLALCIAEFTGRATSQFCLEAGLSTGQTAGSQQNRAGNGAEAVVVPVVVRVIVVAVRHARVVPIVVP